MVSVVAARVSEAACPASWRDVSATPSLALVPARSASRARFCAFTWASRMALRSAVLPASYRAFPAR